MPIYDMYPYSNLHELNLDFIIKLCEEFKDGVEGFEQEITDLETRLEGEIDALEDRIEPFEQMFTLQTVLGETQIRANYRMYAGHGLTASSLKVNGALELEQPFTINLTGDVEGTASTNNLLNPLNIETTVVNGGGGGSQEDVFFDGDVEFFDQSETFSQGAIIAPSGSLKANRLYTVIYDGVEYNHMLSVVDNGDVSLVEAPQSVLSFAIADRAMIIPKVEEGTIKHVKVIKENYDLYYNGDLSRQLTLDDDRYKGMIADGLPLELKAGNYVIIADGTLIELTGAKNAYWDGIEVGQFDSEQFTIAFTESVSSTIKDYREYYVESATLPTDFKIFGPKQTGEMRYVKFFDPTGEGEALTFPNETVAGATLIVENTNYMLQDSHDSAFCWQGKTYLGCSIPGVMASIMQMHSIYGLLALFAAPNLSETVMTVPIKDFKIYYNNNEYDDLHHDSGGEE